jgi:hypothetical protein
MKKMRPVITVPKLCTPATQNTHKNQDIKLKDWVEIRPGLVSQNHRVLRHQPQKGACHLYQGMSSTDYKVNRAVTSNKLWAKLDYIAHRKAAHRLWRSDLKSLSQFIPSRWKTETLPSSVATDHSGQVCKVSCQKRVPDRLGEQSTSSNRESGVHSFASATDHPISRDSGDVAERGNRESSVSGSRILLNVLPGSQKRHRRNEASHQSQRPKQICKMPNFQDAFPIIHNQDDSQRELAGVNRSQRCIFSCSNASETLQTPQIRFPRDYIPVQGSSLPFGLSTAPRVFTKVLAPVVGYLHQQGIFLFPYLDDCLLVAKDQQLLHQSLILTIQTLQNLGFLINFKNLGMEIDTIQSMVFLPRQKAENLTKVATIFLQVGTYKKARHFLKFLGLMASTLMMVPKARLYMRPVQIYLNANWNRKTMTLNHKIMIPLRLVSVIQWWSNIQNLLKGLEFPPKKHSVIVTTDASLTAWGAHCQSQTVQGKWNPHPQTLHINLLELLAV